MLIDAGTELVQQLACGGPLLAQVFDIGPGDGIEGRFGHGADRGNQHHKKDGEQQLSLFDLAPNAITQRLRDLDLMNTTPSQALQILEELKEYL